MKTLKHKVFILESFDLQNEQHFLQEAQDLIEFLKGEEIEYEFHRFSTRLELSRFLSQAGGRLKEDEDKNGVIYLPYLHFICHGCDDGICPANPLDDEVITWEELNELIFGFSYNADKFGKEPMSVALKRDFGLSEMEESEPEFKKVFNFLFKNYTYCLTYLILTSCRGGTLGVQGLCEKANFSFIIGSQKNTYADETGPAFHEFYRSVLEQASFTEILYRMNDFMKNGELEVFISREMKEAFEKLEEEKAPGV